MDNACSDVLATALLVELLGIDSLAELEGSAQPTMIRYKRLTDCKKIKLI